jgi:hypothetical protein
MRLEKSASHTVRAALAALGTVTLPHALLTN